MTLLAGFQALLARYTRQGDLLVGAPVANRERPEIEGLIGFFVNTLVLRTRLGDDPAFAALLTRVRATALGAYDHAHVPFEKLVEELRPGRSLSRTPLFQVALALQNAPDEPLALPGLLLAPVEPESATAKFDLTVILRERPDSLDGVIEYATDLFDGATIERLAGHLATLLAGAAARPGDRLSELPLLTAGEERQILGWSRPEAPDYPRESTVHALVEAQARRTPAAPAVEYGGVLLTYGELESRANRLARHLRRLGVGAEARVGLAVERSADMVVGMLGILKAGAAYVPLDLNYPSERLALMAADSGLAALVARESWGAGLPEVLLDRDRAAIEAESAESPGEAGWGGCADSLAYVMYTSGSTGRPKGVAIPHRGIVRLILETDYVQIEPADRIAQVSNTSFDAATLEIWGALMTGACAVGLEREVTLSPEGLEEAIAARGVTLMFLTTALFNQVARQRPGAFRPMRYLFFGGEACDPNAVRAVLQSGPPERLVHCYGPTESTTFSVCRRVEAVADGAASVPIGGVISHTEGYVVDPDFRMVPAGVPGELLLGGDGLARGYWGRPDLTAERFVPSPWSGRPGERVYRSGDLVRWTAAGPLEFVARIDQQVKIRGFRVEPGEIEAALCAHPAVRAAAVMAREDQPGNRRLVAYVVPEAAAAPEAAELRAFLRESLPEYMVPAAFASLAELPLTPNGKVDHRALPAPDGAASAEAYTAPRNAVEELQAAVWWEVLGHERIGVHDDFFDLGGHSLLAVRLVSRIRDDFGIEIQVKTIFDAPTVAELAELLAQELARQAGEGDLEQLFAEAREEPHG
jgi:amino acid adenylation domain-containing protein